MNIRYRFQNWLVDLANALEGRGSTPTPYPPFRRVDSKRLENLGTKHSCDAYSYEHLQSLMKQEGPDYTLGQLFDESGWVEIGPDNIDMVRREFAKAGIDMDDDTGELSAGDKR
jgi:hypothetical protein